MSNGYRVLVDGISNVIFTSSKILLRSIPKSMKENNEVNVTKYYSSQTYSIAERAAIRKDFSKVGKDLFGALNAYERHNKLKITTR